MDLLLSFGILLAGLVLGGLLAGILGKIGGSAEVTRLHGQLIEAESLRAAAEERASQIPKLEAAIQQKDEKILALTSRQATLETRLVETEKVQANLGAVFAGVAANALDSNNRNFLTLAETAFQKSQETAKGDLDVRQKSIDESIKPLRDALERIETQRISLSTEVKLLHEAHVKVGEETSKLANALKAPSGRGRWGEIQLRRVVHLAGMVEHCDFQEQVSVNTEDGKLRPDMIIQLPNNHEIVVDSKVPLAAYLAAFDTLDDNERQAKMAEHVNQVRARVRELSDKEYWSQFKKSPDFVVMFLPDETFFSAALQMDPELIEFGVKRRVLLATPTTLIALLKSAAFGWRQDSLAQNAQQISDLGKELYDRIRIFAQHMDGVRGGIEQSVRSYNKAVGSLETRVLASARRFKDLSATTAGDLPESLPVDTTLRVLTAGSGE